MSVNDKVPWWVPDEKYILLVSATCVLSTLGCRSNQAELDKAQKALDDSLAVFNHKID